MITLKNHVSSSLGVSLLWDALLVGGEVHWKLSVTLEDQAVRKREADKVINRVFHTSHMRQGPQSTRPDLAPFVSYLLLSQHLKT